MNSSKRGGVFGFRLQSLDIVSIHVECGGLCRARPRPRALQPVGIVHIYLTFDLTCTNIRNERVQRLVNNKFFVHNEGEPGDKAITCCYNCILIGVQISDTRAPSDRSITLMHFVAGVVREKYPMVLDFMDELTYLEKAAAGKYILYVCTWKHVERKAMQCRE